MFSTFYGTWFFLELENGDATAGEAKFSEMDTDCLDLVKFFFGNEMIVGFLTLFQCFVLMCCGYMKSRHLREIEGETELNTKRNQYFMNEIKESRLKSFKNGPSRESTGSSSSKKKSVHWKEFHNDDSIENQND